jgi:UPF0176 protein
MPNYRVAALYRFVDLPNFAELQPLIAEKMHGLNIKGTVLLANEGINGTVAGSAAEIESFVDCLKKDSVWENKFADLDVKFSNATNAPFARAKVKLKKEIVTMGVGDLAPQDNAGAYVEPEDWNELIRQPDMVTIDTRNNYEVGLGKFKGALNPQTESFREFPDFAKQSLDPKQHKKVAMYCTGGIRCEKSTAYLKSLGFEEVYHLRGGILRYLEQVPQEESLWDGECFVFDDRVAIDHQLNPGSYTQCHACRLPLTDADLEHPHYVAGESCHHCFTEKTDAQRQRYRERQKQIQLAKERGEKHIGDQVKEVNAQRRAAKYNAKGQQREQPKDAT